MIKETIDFVQSTSAAYGFFLYWIPVALCLLGLAGDIIRGYTRDIKSRQDSKWYTPTLTVGRIVGWAILSFLPVVNIFRAAFTYLPAIVAWVVDKLDTVLNIPLVPKKDIEQP